MTIKSLASILASLLILLVVTSRLKVTAFSHNTAIQHNRQDQIIQRNWTSLHHRHHPARVLHDSLLRNSRSRDTTRHYHAKSLSERLNDTTKSTHHQPDNHDKTDEPEKLTALAVAEYSGTRAVAYAGYHGDQHGIVVSRDGFTTSTPSYTRHHTG